MHPKISIGRVAIYARYSSDRQSEASIEDQVRRAHDVIARAGGDPEKATVFPDFAISGASMQRPGLEALLRAVDKKKVDVILTEDLSRLSRDMADSAQIFKRLQFAGVPLISISDGIDTSQKQAKLNFALKSLLADLYVDDLRDKTLRGLEGRHLAGMATGQVPYGYKTVAQKDRYGRTTGSEIMIDTSSAEVVRRVFEMYRAGDAFHVISRTLIREGVPSARQRTRHTRFGWGAPGISAMLRQEKYIGVWRFKERQWVKEPGTNRRIPRRRPSDEVMIAERPELRVINDELWNAVQEKLRERSRGGGRKNERILSPRKSKYLLSGIVVCDECGKPLTVYGSTTTYYRCQTHHSKGTCSSDLRIREDVLRRDRLEAMRLELQVPMNIEYVRDLVVERMRGFGRELRNEIEMRRERLKRTQRRIDELQNLGRRGQSVPNVRKEIRALRAQAHVEGDAIESLRRGVKRPPVSGPDEITAAAFRIEEILHVDIARSRIALMRWLANGEIRVRKSGDVVLGGLMPTEAGPAQRIPSDGEKMFLAFLLDCAWLQAVQSASPGSGLAPGISNDAPRVSSPVDI